MNDILKKVGQKGSDAMGWVRNHSEDLTTGFLVTCGALYLGLMGAGIVAVGKDIASETPAKPHPQTDSKFKVVSVTLAPREDK